MQKDLRAHAAMLSAISAVLLAQAAQGAVLEEVVVTAQQREQSLQDVPVAVTAITAADLDRGVITDIIDLQNSVPSLVAYTANRPASSTAFYLRGIGTSGSDAGLEGAVGFFVDNVYRSRSGTALGDLVDIESVQVLRGPQGTLFGKNTTAGAITVRTVAPIMNESEAKVGAMLGNYGATRFTGSVNIPMIDDTLALRFSGSRNQRDGFIEDPVSGLSYNDRDRWFIDGKLLYTPTANLGVLLRVDHAQASESCCQTVRRSNTPGSPVVALLNGLAEAGGFRYPVSPDPTRYRNSINGPAPVADFDDSGISLQVDWGIGEASLTSVTGYRVFESFTANDVDFTGADLLYQSIDFDAQTFSQEFRLQGLAQAGRFDVDWLVGAFYADERIDWSEAPDLRPDLQPYFSALLGNPALGSLYAPMDNFAGNDARQEGESFALFTHNIIALSDRWNLTLGLRYTSDEKEAVSEAYSNYPGGQLPFSGLGLPFPPQHSYDLEFSDESTNGAVTLDYTFSDQLMVYASASTGYKAGGFVMVREAAGPLHSTNAACSQNNDIAFEGGGLPAVYNCDPRDPRFDSETVEAFEVGVRSELFDRRLSLNVTAFYADYSDLQLNVFDGLSFVIRNAGSAVTRGFEVDSSYLAPIEGLSFSLSLAFTDTEYGSEVPALQTGEPALGGEPLQHAPRWSGALAMNYDVTLGGRDAFLRAEYAFTDEQFSSTRIDSIGEELSIGSFQIFNMSLGLELVADLEIGAFCRNCLDERYANFLANSVGQPGSKEAFIANPREFGLNVSKRF
jgi:outer membrane receptor protein involved in Fe transport